MTEQRLRMAMGLTLPVLIFCFVYSALQVRRVQQETAVLRVEIEALRSTVSRIQGTKVGAAMRAVPSPRPTSRKVQKAKTKAVSKAAKGEKTKGKKRKAKANLSEEGGDVEPQSPRKGKAKNGKKRKAKGKGKAQ